MHRPTPVEIQAELLCNSMPDQTRRTAFKVAAMIFSAAGEQESDTGRAFIKLASVDPGPQANCLASCVHRVLGRHQKQAGSIGGSIKNLATTLLPAGLANATDLAKILAGGAMAAGGVAGAGAFGLHRALTKEDQRLLELQQERNMMRQLTKDIERELQVRNLQPTPQNTAKVVDYLT